MASRSARSRCVSGKSVVYLWAGESLGQTSEQGETMSKTVASWFADKAANQELANGNIDFRRFDKYRIKLEAFLEEKLNRLQEGKLTPGSEVIEVKHASSRVIFELRWHFEAAAQHKGKTQIRHYEAEPVEVRNSVFGLVLHVKDITGTGTEITEKQNRQIEIAEILYDECSKNDWRLS